MPIKSSRFSRMAYARRAALLAEDLAEWHAIYVRSRTTHMPWMVDSSERARLEERISALQDMTVRLRDISSELVALR